MRLGDRTPGVRAWQDALRQRGYQVVVDGIFGPRTHNATLAFQAQHGLPSTGKVGTRELQVVEAPVTASIRPPPVLQPELRYIEARYHGRTPRAVIDRIVLHCMEAPEASTRAWRCAQYFANLPPDLPPKEQKSSHYCADSDSVVQCVPDHLVAFAAPGCNHDGLQIELAGYARQTREEWLDAFGLRMLSLVAQLCARKCIEWKIPVAFLRAPDLLTSARGITTHYEVSMAFRRSTHTDPGPGFPMDRFIAQVRMALDTLEARA
jgi:N-acetyl-anhydromuramyl-L-alanine amidase AmpD